MLMATCLLRYVYGYLSSKDVQMKKLPPTPTPLGAVGAFLPQRFFRLLQAYWRGQVNRDISITAVALI